MSFPYIYIPGSSLTIIINNAPHIIDKSHGQFERCVDALKSGDWELLKTVTSMANAIVQYSKGMISIIDDQVYFDGQVIDNTLASRIVEMFKQNFDIDPMVNFLDNLVHNPSQDSINELYGFLEYGKLPLTSDGCFLAYKKVRSDYKDIYSGSIDNYIGAHISMDRTKVNPDRDQTCSYGLHVCSYDYLPHYNSDSNDRVVIVKVNPRDVVSVPSDYSNTKARVCRYSVVGEHLEYRVRKAFNGAVETKYDTPVQPETDVVDQDVCNFSQQDRAQWEAGYKVGYGNGRHYADGGKVRTPSKLYAAGYKLGVKHGRNHKRKWTFEDYVASIN